jgi:hypothetical protein
VRSFRLVVVVVACTLGAPGCGNERTKPADIFTPVAPAGTREARFPAAGMSFSAPRNWRLGRRTRPAVFVLTSGEAVVSGWAYRRKEPLPRGRDELRQASNRLLREVKDRDPRFALADRRTLRVDGAPAIELLGQQIVQRRPLRTRSVHVFRGRVEYVIEVLTPPKDFPRVDSQVLRPLLDSLKLKGRA